MWPARFFFCLILTAVAAAPLQAAVVTEEVEYEVHGTRLLGYLAYDDAIAGERPGVLVVHEWWGLNDYARQRARQLAELGYTAFAIDMYGDGRHADHPDQAGALMAQVSERWDEARARFRAGLDVLQAQRTTDADRIAAIGYCFGGGVVLNMARSGLDIDGVVSFHGSLSSDIEARPGQVKTRVLVLHGADDPFIPLDDVNAFKEEMAAAEVDYRFIAYPGAVHGFTNPDADGLGERFGLPLAYDAAADQASWKEMRAFFDRIFAD